MGKGKRKANGKGNGIEEEEVGRGMERGKKRGNGEGKEDKARGKRKVKGTEKKKTGRESAK